MKYKNSNNIFCKRDLKKAKKIEFIKSLSGREKDKIYRRLHTCSYDIDHGMVYMSGIISEEVICFQLSEINRAELAEFVKYDGNCEDKNFRERLIAFISCKYIDKLGKEYPEKNKIILGQIDERHNQKIFVDCYLEIARRQRHFFDEESYEKLKDLQVGLIEKRSIYAEWLSAFFKYDKNQFVYGKTMKGPYVKFSFSEDRKEEFLGRGDGKYYKFKENKVAEDYFDGSGFSFGEINKAFFYFQYGRYGERIMFVETLPREKYYRQEYEYLGRKLKIKKIDKMSNVENLKYILRNMTDEMKEKFFKNITSEYFTDSFGSVDITIGKMQEYDKRNGNEEYKAAIGFLLKGKEKYV